MYEQHPCNHQAMIFIDLREEIYEFVGPMPEAAWLQDETLSEFGTPISLVGEALAYVLENQGDPESFMRLHPTDFRHQENHPWDVFYLKTVYRLAYELAPWIDLRNVCDYDLLDGILQIHLVPKPFEDQPKVVNYARPYHPPRS